MVEYRSLQRVAFLMMITLGLYFIFWFHGVSKELLAYNGRKGSPGLWVIGFGFVFTFPILVMIPIWKLAQQVSAASEGKYNTFFLVTTGIFIVPLIYLTQKLLNEIALEQQERMAAGGFDEPRSADPGT